MAPSLRDWKSTRLNSSHLGISYAVFCLKKKKKTEAERSTDGRLGVCTVSQSRGPCGGASACVRLLCLSSVFLSFFFFFFFFFFRTPPPPSPLSPPPPLFLFPP